MKKRKKLWLIGIIVLLAGAGALMKSLMPVDTETATVQKTSVTATVTEKGRVVSEGTGDVFCEVQGRVKAVYVDEGDPVKAGMLLAEIDTGEIDAQIAQTEGELAAIGGSSSLSAASLVRQQQSALEQAKVALNLARDNFDRIRRLYDLGAATKAELDQARADMDAKQKAVNQASAALEASKAQFSGQKESLLARLAYLRQQKAKARIVAARNETVLSKKIKAGDMVSPGTLLFSLGDTGQIKVEAFVVSKNMSNLREGTPVTVVFDSLGKSVKVAGMVTRIAPAAEERLSPLGIMEDKVKINVGLKEKPPGIRVFPGTGVDVVIVTQQADNVLAVPKEAVFSEQEKEFVWAVRDGKAVLAEVVTGIEGDDLTEVTKGLSAGDQVVLNPHQDFLKEGVRIK